MSRLLHHRLFRGLGFAISFALAATAVWLLSLYVVRKTGVGRQSMVLDIVPYVRAARQRLLREHRYNRVALVGDSVLLSATGDRDVPEDIRTALRRRGERPPRAVVQPFVWPALGPIAQYCLADEIVAAHPDLIVLEINLRSVGPVPLHSLSYPELGGYVHAERFAETALLPLSDANITFDRLLLYRAIVAGDATRHWMDLLDRQARLLHLSGIIEDWIEQKVGNGALFARRAALYASVYSRATVPGRKRGTRAAVEYQLGSVIDGLPSTTGRLRVLAATLRVFKRARIPVLVWVPPTNLEYFRSLGFRVDGLARSVESIGLVAKEGGATFVDLHASLPDAAFYDSGDHVTTDGTDGSRLLGEHLATAIVSALTEIEKERREAP